MFSNAASTAGEGSGTKYALNKQRTKTRLRRGMGAVKTSREGGGRIKYIVNRLGKDRSPMD